MKIWKNMSIGALALAICGSMGSMRAGASEILYDGVGFMQGTQSFTDSFSLSSPGTLTVTLANVSWPTQLASLDLLMSSPSGALGPELDATNSTATATYNVTSGNVVAQWFGTAQGSLNAGVYALEVQFQPSTNPVPLPTSIALFLSGIGLLVWQRRTRTTGGPADPHDLSAAEGAQTA
jgi:hypothetical protein